MLTTVTGGIFQGDIIMRTALIQGIRELRNNPDLLDYCFASLLNDDLTAKTYGESTIEKAKRWFKDIEIPVALTLRVGSPKFPCITVELQASQEAETTLGDVHYQASETYRDPWPAVTPTFSAQYDPDTGYLTIPDSITGAYLIFVNMLVVSRKGNVYPILETIDESTVRLAEDLTTEDFGQCVLKYSNPANYADLESLEMRGSFAIGCHVQGEVEELIWLSSIVQFVILRYKQTYLEARGFERSVISVTGPTHDSRWGVEAIYSQYVNLQGHYRNYWPKTIGIVPQGILLEPLRIAVGQASPEGMIDEQSSWIMDEDEDVLAGARLVGVKGSAAE
jgi:hypothetical protein